MVKWVTVSHADTMRLGWTRLGVRPEGERQRLTCADVRSGLLSLVGLVGFEPATP
jgi:hypothetical protein